MARYNIRDIIQAISLYGAGIAPGDVVGPNGDETDFTRFLSEANPPVLATRNNVEDNSVGDGRVYKKQSKPYWYQPINWPFAAPLNTNMGVRVFLDWLGGTISSVVNTVPGTTDWTIQQKNAGAAPNVFLLIRDLGGESFLHADNFVQTIEIAQQGATEPRISGNFQNSGFISETNVAPVSGITIGSIQMPRSTPTYKRFHGAKTSLTFTDGVTSYDFATDGRLIDVSFSGNQNVVVDQLPGDPFVSTTECEGAFSRSFFIDVQSASMKAKVFMDATFAEFASWKANKKLTSVKLIFSTCEIIGATTHHFEYEIQFPIAQFNLEPDQQGNFSAFSFNIEAIEGDPTTGSLVIGRIREATAAGAPSTWII